MDNCDAVFPPRPVPVSGLGALLAPESLSADVGVVCFSHLRWDFVFQRPHHLFSRFARQRPVLWVEEPVVNGAPEPRLDVRETPQGVHVAVPFLPSALDTAGAIQALRTLLQQELDRRGLHRFVSWYYTPMALPYTEDLQPELVVYDCMDELSAFKGAPARLADLERQLFSRADLAFTGGLSLYRAKRDRHHNIYGIPSSIDVEHYRHARVHQPEPADQSHIPHPRLGFFGVIDERMDLDLLAGLADARPDWHIVLLGPFAKIDPAEVPQRANLHYLGRKTYEELPSYVAGWDVALLPFARNEATRFISPTKTPEYLAAGRPVVSTSIEDVVHPYGEAGLAHIADSVPEFVSAVEAALEEGVTNRTWLAKVDRLLANTSWDRTWGDMASLMATTHRAVHGRDGLRPSAAAAEPGRSHV
jgi:UDP-galactopyranose mutase